MREYHISGAAGGAATRTILAYAPAYLWAARAPEVRPPIVAVALVGKAIGALGWCAGLITRQFPLRSLPLPLLNDLVWLPGMLRLLRDSGTPA